MVMAANTLREAIFTALTEKGLDLTENQIRNIEGNLRDFFAHEISRIIGPPPKDGTVQQQDDWLLHELHLSLLFHRIFKDVSSYQMEDK